MQFDMRPLISIVVPAYNTAPWIGEAVQSALGQSISGIEVIVIDDGSSDDTYAVVSSIRDPRLRVVRQENAGLCAARNAGIRLSSGPYVGFLDSDDVWMPHKLREHVSVLDSRPDVDLTFSWSAIVAEDGTPAGHVVKARAGATTLEDILTLDPINNGSCVVLRREALDRAGPFDTGLRACTDHDMWLRIARLRPANAWCIPQPLTCYRRRSGQITKSWRLARTETTKVMQKLRVLEPGLGPSVWRRAESANRAGYAFMAYEGGEAGQALRLAAPQMLYRPWTMRKWSLLAAIVARLLLPARLFHLFKGLRASTKRLSSGRLSSSAASGTSPH